MCDVFKRVLTDYFHCNVQSAGNVTDIDDKIVRAAEDEGVGVKDISARYSAEHFRHMDLLNVRRDDVTVQVSSCIEDICHFIKTLLDRGHAHVCADGVRMNRGSVGNLGEAMQPFSLWKLRQKDTPGWDSPFGYGRPGWHVECSAITHSLFSDLTFHAGGVDLRFPHHHNESIQNRCFAGKDMVRCWVHVGHLEIAGCKMSKSKKNFVTLSECDAHPNSLRMLFLSHPWRKSMTYSNQAVEQAATNMQKLLSLLQRPVPPSTMQAAAEVGGHATRINNALANDMDLSTVMHELLQLAQAANNHPAMLHRAQPLLQRTLHMLGFVLTPTVDSGEIVAARDQLRRQAAASEAGCRKELFKISDRIRAALGLEDNAPVCTPVR